MKLFDSKTFNFEGKDFEIRTFYDDATINVVAFFDGYPANGYRYQVKIPKQCDAEKVLENFPVPELVEKCEKDIKAGNWDKLLKIIRENKTDRR